MRGISKLHEYKRSDYICERTLPRNFKLEGKLPPMRSTWPLYALVAVGLLLAALVRW